MNLKKLQYSYILLGVLACLLAWFEYLSYSIATRWVSLFLICFIYFLQLKEKAFVFYAITFFAAIAHTYTALGVENYTKQVIFPLFIYCWLLFFVLKKRTKKLEKAPISVFNLLMFFLSIGLVLYLIFSVLSVVNSELGDNKNLVYVFSVNFAVLLLYMGILCLNNLTNNFLRFIWLLFLLIAFLITALSTGLEAYYYPSKVIRQIIYIAEIATNFFLLKFILTANTRVKNL